MTHCWGSGDCTILRSRIIIPELSEKSYGIKIASVFAENEAKACPHLLEDWNAGQEVWSGGLGIWSGFVT